MKKIFLIDDDSNNQRESYGASFVDDGEYSEILSHIEKLNKDSDFSFLNDSELILIHDSLEDYIDGEFKEKSNYAKDIIINYAEDHGILYCCFSDGHGPIGEFENNISLEGSLLSIKKSEFYGRLQAFLDYYKSTSNYELKILAFGKNYKKTILEKNIKHLFGKLSKLEENTILEIKDINPRKNLGESNYLKNIIEMAQPALGKDYEDVVDVIQERNLTVKELKKQISEILSSVTRYGKNTYTWE